VITILDVVDNFFGSKRLDPLGALPLPGKLIAEFGQAVRAFAATFKPPKLEREFPIYMGGWPSANVWCAARSRLAVSAVLYCGQVVAKDPLSDWFSDEQYQVPHLMRSRPGYRDPRSGELNIAASRQFLRAVLPGLVELRPLIEKEVLVLVPSESIALRRRDESNSLTTSLMGKFRAQTERIAERFTPSDLAVEDNCRGTFVFTGGQKEQQVAAAIEEAVTYFAREYLLATDSGSSYCAPFLFEQFVLEEGLGELLFEGPRHRVLQAVITSKLPLLQQVDPSLLATIHDDELFGQFRAELHAIYENLPPSAEGIQRYLAEQEQDLLAPKLREVSRSVDRGALKRFGLEHAGLIAGLGAGIAVGTVSGDFEVAVMSVGLGRLLPYLLDRLKESRVTTESALPIWTKLYRHQLGVVDELPTFAAQGDLSLGEPFWGIPAEASMAVQVSAGLLVAEHIPHPSQGAPPAGGYSEGVYRPCPCGSGLRYKFCCQGSRFDGLRSPASD